MKVQSDQDDTASQRFHTLLLRHGAPHGAKCRSNPAHSSNAGRDCFVAALLAMTENPCTGSSAIRNLRSGRRLLRDERFAEIAIGLSGPDFAQGLLGGVAERIVFIAALRERRDAARQRAAVGGEVHDRPGPAAQRPRRTLIAAFEAHAGLGGGARGAEGDAERCGERRGALDMVASSRESCS